MLSVDKALDFCCYARGVPTAIVTCGGIITVDVCPRKSWLAENSSSVDTARQSGARDVRGRGWQETQTDEKNVIGAEALNPAGKTTPPKKLLIL